MKEPCNIAAALPRLARERPEQIAIRCPGRPGFGGMAAYDLTLSYRELDRRSDAMAAGFSAYGIGRGVRAVVMVRPSPEFFLLMFALFKVGAVPVLVDPGIDRSALKQCLSEAEPQAFIGVFLAQLARRLLRWAPSVTRVVSVGTLGHGVAPRWCTWSVLAQVPAHNWPIRLPTRWPRFCSPVARQVCLKEWCIVTGILSVRSRCCGKRLALCPEG